MAISFTLPKNLEAGLRRQVTDLNHEAKEAFLVELYRQQKLSHAQLAEALGLSRYDTDGVLKRHEVYYELTVDDVLRDAAISRQARAE